MTEPSQLASVEAAVAMEAIRRAQAELVGDDGPPLFEDGEIPVPPPDLVEVAAAVPVSLETTPITGVDLAKPLPQLQYIVRGLAMPSGPGAPHCFGGFGFSGKTVAMQSVLLALAAQRAVWRAHQGPGRVMRCSHIDNEQGVALTQRRYQRLAKGQRINLEELGDALRLYVYPKLTNGTRIMLIKDHRAWWQELMSERDLLAIDSLAASKPSDVSENDTEIRRSIDMLSELSEETKCRALLIHHANKGSGDEKPGQERDARFVLRGSGGIFDAFDSAYLLSGQKSEAVQVQHIKARAHGEPIGDFALVIEDHEKPEDEPVEADQDPSRWGLSVHVMGMELIEEQREKKADEKQAAILARDVARVRKALAGGRRLSRTDLGIEARLSNGFLTRAWNVLMQSDEGTVERVREGRTITHFHSLKGSSS